MKKKQKWTAVFLTAVLFLLAGCSSESASTASADAAAEMHVSGDGSVSIEQESDSSEAAGTGDTASGNSSLQAENPDRKLVRTQTVEMETTEFDSFETWLQSRVEAAEGYVENGVVSGREAGSSALRSASYKLRIPEKGLGGFMVDLRAEGNVTYYTESVEDVTLNYTDTESHIAALEQEQATLMEMLSQSGDLDTLLAIQNRLTEVRYQLENYASQLRLYDNEIQYSTVYLELREVERVTAAETGSFAGQLSERLSSNFYALGRGFQNFALWFLGALPFWILLAALGSAAYGIWRRVRKKRAGGKSGDTEENSGKEKQQMED